MDSLQQTFIVEKLISKHYYFIFCSDDENVHWLLYGFFGR